MAHIVMQVDKNISTQPINLLIAMKLNKVLEDILGKRSSISILRVLIDRDIELTGRQIAELTGLNHRSCLLSLEELGKQGVVTRRSAGSANLYGLKKENFLIKEGVIPLFKLEKKLIEKAIEPIIDVAETFRDVLSIILFGSMARGDEEPDSDIDVCIVVQNQYAKEDLSDELENVGDKTIKHFGNELSLYIITVRKFNEQYLNKDPLIMEIIKENVVWGKPTEALLKNETGNKKD